MAEGKCGGGGVDFRDGLLRGIDAESGDHGVTLHGNVKDLDPGWEPSLAR